MPSVPVLSALTELISGSVTEDLNEPFESSAMVASTTG